MTKISCSIHSLNNFVMNITGRIDPLTIRGAGPEYPTIFLSGELFCSATKDASILFIEKIIGNIHLYKPKKFKIGAFDVGIYTGIESTETPINFTLEIPISFHALEQIEKHREENLELFAEIKIVYLHHKRSPSNLNYANTTNQGFKITIPQSKWIDVLKQIGYTELKLIEIPYPKEINVDEFDQMIHHLNIAKKYFIEGDYNKTVAECRLVVEIIPNLLDINKVKPKNGIKPSQNERLEQFIKQHVKPKIESTKSKVLEKQVKELWNICSRAHHSTTDPTKTINFSRKDAGYILDNVISVLSYLSKILYE